VFGINSSEFVLLILVAVVVVGPERLPRYAEQLGVWVRTLRGLLRTAKQRVDEELGEQAGDVDWTALDPRRYDPRRIVREALVDDSPWPPSVDPGASTDTPSVGPAVAAGAAAGSADLVGVADAAGSAGVPYDDEAT